MKRNIFLISLALALVSCESQTNFNKVIVNDSSYDLMIVRWFGTEVSDTVMLPVGQEQKLFVGSSYTQKVTDFKDCNFESYYGSSDSIKVYNDSTHKVLINLNDNSKWTYIEVSKQKHSDKGRCDCLIHVSDSDID